MLGVLAGCAEAPIAPTEAPDVAPATTSALLVVAGDSDRIPAIALAPEAGAASPGPSLGVAADRVCVLAAAGRAECVRPGATAPAPLELDGAARLVTAESGVCAIRVDDTVVCDGFALPELGETAALALGRDHFCALSRSGTLRCWRPNDPTTVAPVRMPGRVTQLDAKFEHVCAVTTHGAVYCWGDNGSGQLGVTRPGHSDVPLEVPGLTDVVEVSTGGDHTCAREASGRVLCWGAGSYLQAGVPTAPNFVPPTPVPTVRARRIAAGAHHTCALTDTGVVCWGWNLWGQMGEPKADQRPPLPVAGLAGAVEIGAHGAVTCALLPGERVACLGGYSADFFGPWGAGDFVPREDRRR
jgi:hypothetical protein